MAKSATVSASIDEKTKAEAKAVLSSIGLSISDAFRLLLTRVAQEKALPFDPLIPNEQTIAAMRKAREGRLTSFDSMDKLIEDLNAKD